MADIAPETVVTVTAFGNEAVDMWIPFQIPAECVEDHDKAGGEVHGLVLFEKHTGNNTVYRMEKAAKQSAVLEEKIPQVFVNGKDTVPVPDIHQLKGHIGSPFHGIFIAASGTETAFAAERDEFELPAVWAAVHGTAKGGVTAVNHFFDIFQFRFAGMESIFNFFEMVAKDFL